jgi:hypothetical protein
VRPEDVVKSLNENNEELIKQLEILGSSSPPRDFPSDVLEKVVDAIAGKITPLNINDDAVIDTGMSTFLAKHNLDTMFAEGKTMLGAVRKKLKNSPPK